MIVLFWLVMIVTLVASGVLLGALGVAVWKIKHGARSVTWEARHPFNMHEEF